MHPRDRYVLERAADGSAVRIAKIRPTASGTLSLWTRPGGRAVKHTVLVGPDRFAITVVTHPQVEALTYRTDRIGD